MLAVFVTSGEKVEGGKHERQSEEFRCGIIISNGEYIYQNGFESLCKELGGNWYALASEHT